MDETEFKERRKFRRFVIKVPSTYFEFSLNKGYDTQTNDISAKGIGFISNVELPVKTRIDIWIKPPDQEKQIFARGEVIWSAKTELNKYRLGVTLEDPGIKPLPIVLRMLQAQL